MPETLARKIMTEYPELTVGADGRMRMRGVDVNEALEYHLARQAEQVALGEQPIDDDELVIRVCMTIAIVLDDREVDDRGRALDADRWARRSWRRWSEFGLTSVASA